MTHMLLVGNPNCGKTTLFNALTGENQRIGNWPGVTVEQKTGLFVFQEQTIQVTDLPGVYSLGATDELSQDEQITAQAILSLEADAIINVIDACHLERHLYLTSQLLERGKSVIVVLNMIDVAQQLGITINIPLLSQRLGCPVIPIQAHKKIGLSALEQALVNYHPKNTPLILQLPEPIQKVLATLESQLINEGHEPMLAYYMAHRLAEGGMPACTKPIDQLDVILADARYQAIHQIATTVQLKKSDASEHITAKIDRVVLHRVWALPIFLAIMYCMFLFAINIGGAFQDFFDLGSNTIFVEGTAWLLQQIQAPNWLIALLAQGVGKGINTTLTFIPVIAAMFFFLSLLETSGYMARAAFVVDKAMRFMGLPGKAFVPMIVGFGCNVPAIMAARTLDSERDRLLTILMSPFMSCSARLAIYAVFVAAFFPSGGQNIVFSLYIMGILMAILTGFLLRRTLLKGNAAPLILELPVYHKPSFSRLIKETSIRLRFFVLRAGKLIIPICVVLGALNSITFDGQLSTSEANTHSLLSLLGQGLTPLFAPMGIHPDNWPATVGLLTGMLAKEVVVGTLNSLYGSAEHLSAITVAHYDFWAGIKAACWSVPQNLLELGSALWNPILDNAADSSMSSLAYGSMAQHFDGKIGAYAYLLFVLLYIPCVSTMAVIRQEANKKLMWFSVIWSFLLAYMVAVGFYQVAKWVEYSPLRLLWIIALLFSLLLVLKVHFATKQSNKETRHATANS